jgi:hypothetical protein
MLRRMSLSVLAVLFILGIAGVASAGMVWDYTNSFLTKSPDGAYDQSAWSPWSAGWLDATGSLSKYGYYAGNIAGGLGLWQYASGDYDIHGHACKNLTDHEISESIGGKLNWSLGAGQTAVMTGYGRTTDIRWTAPAAGTYSVSGTFTNQKGDASPVGVTVSVLAGTSTLFTTDINIGDPAVYYTSDPITLAAGGTIDLRASAGQSIGWAGIQFQVAEVPEPGSIVLSLSGLLGLLAYAWRKRR